MAQFDHQAHCVAIENIARFEEKLKRGLDTRERKLLEGFLVLEREKLKAISASAP